MASLWDDLDSLVNTPSSFSAKTGDRGTIKPKAGFDAGEDAVALRKAIEGLGTTEKTLIDILTHRSSAQRQQICEAYQEATGRVRLCYLLKCVKSVPAYFAERLYQSMKGGGTDESTLNRVMVSRSEIDLLDIRAEFKKLYEYSLHSAIESDCGGNYKKTLVKICGGDDDS
ncbi:annexin A3a [Acanthopagrus latus]|uniref:annexin A3a n=1 Tax=Acanthopagrus latus TaxID=8177 RepID=UPI00187CB36E|nr:annexin A3a [Acanthopagrus latus]